MMREIDPMTTSRAQCYALFKDAPLPMLTIFKTLNITKLMRKSKKGYKINMLMCYCIGQAMKEIPEMKCRPMNGKFYEFDRFGINIIIENRQGTLNFCDVPVIDNLDDFNKEYLKTTSECREQCVDHYLPDTMTVATSALPKFDIDGAVNLYHTIFGNPFMVWAKYRKHFFKYTLKTSLQFHHIQMDGKHACQFLDAIQKHIDEL